MAECRTCEQCGVATPKRRDRCPECKLLLCPKCWGGPQAFAVCNQCFTLAERKLRTAEEVD